jgi:hypothetical protein
MSKKFWAENRTTGERWAPRKNTLAKSYLVLYDSGYLAVVHEDFYTTILPLDPKEWKLCWRKNES